jgi:uncharacterized protein (TIGR02147 family)
MRMKQLINNERIVAKEPRHCELELNMEDYILTLKTYLTRKQDKNPLYSMRAFARDLNVSPGSISQILNGFKTPSIPLAVKMSSALNFKRIEQQQFVKSVALALAEKEDVIEETEFEPFSIDNYEIISKWYHYAIMELTFVSDFESDPKWISGKLGVDEELIIDALERLVSTKLLKLLDGKYIKTQEYITTSNKNLTNEGLKKYQCEMLEMAKTAVENVEHDRRSMQGMTMAIAPEKMGVAKKMIESFLNDLCIYLEDGERKEVYQLGTYLFPCNKKGGSKA